MGIKSFRQETMVVKTEVCHYCELKIYPGHGTKIITREGKIHIYLHKKARHQAIKKIKVQQIKWTTAWRRHNKKIKVTDQQKKKRRRAKKVVREIVGMTADEINRKKNETNNERNAKMNEATRQIKERRAKIAKASQVNKPAKTFTKNVPKGGKQAGKR